MIRFAGSRGVVATLIALCVIAVAPAAASAALANRGPHGAVTQCRFLSQELEGWSGAMRLKRITVQAPTLYTIDTSGRVGWRVLVQRRYNVEPWKRIFASRIKRADATPTTPAAFSPLSALINSPLFVKRNGEFVGVDYRVVLRFYWYAPDGSIMRTERHVVQNYDMLRDGGYIGTDPGFCHHSFVFI